MKIYNYSSARGKQIYEMGNRCYAPTLSYLYNNPSYAKEKAYDWCYEQYLKTENSSAFGVGSANTFTFTASWLGTLDGEEIMRVETMQNSYLIYLNR